MHHMGIALIPDRDLRDVFFILETRLSSGYVGNTGLLLPLPTPLSMRQLQ